MVGMGDSLGSGEGNPESGTGTGANWQNKRCDRSFLSYQALAAMAIERADEKTSVTFVHLACSGASILDPTTSGTKGGLLAPYEGIHVESPALRPQLEVATKLIGEREVDAVLLSAGVNDLEFGNLVLLLRLPARRRHRQRRTRRGLLRQALPGQGRHVPPTAPRIPAGRLPPAARGLSAAERRVAVVRREEHAEQARPHHAIPGFAEQRGRQPVPGPRPRHGQGVLDCAPRERGRAALELVPGTPQRGGCGDGERCRSLVGRQPRGRIPKHGYCAANSWIVQRPESITKQGNDYGALHPNKDGHEWIAAAVAKELKAQLLPGGKPRKPS